MTGCGRLGALVSGGSDHDAKYGVWALPRTGVNRGTAESGGIIAARRYLSRQQDYAPLVGGRRSCDSGTCDVIAEKSGPLRCGAATRRLAARAARTSLGTHFRSVADSPRASSTPFSPACCGHYCTTVAQVNVLIRLVLVRLEATISPSRQQAVADFLAWVTLGGHSSRFWATEPITTGYSSRLLLSCELGSAGDTAVALKPHRAAGAESVQDPNR